MEHSKQDLRYLDPETNEKYLPYVIEPSVGLDRLFLAVLCDGLKREEIASGDVREVFKVHPYLAPVKATILPLIKKKHSDKAMEVYAKLCSEFNVTYDEAGSIGKRYRRCDAIGTPFAITIDDESLENNTVTIRDRDTMSQETIKIEELVNYINERIKY